MPDQLAKWRAFCFAVELEGILPAGGNDLGCIFLILEFSNFFLTAIFLNFTGGKTWAQSSIEKLKQIINKCQDKVYLTFSQVSKVLSKVYVKVRLTFEHTQSSKNSLTKNSRFFGR